MHSLTGHGRVAASLFTAALLSASIAIPDTLVAAEPAAQTNLAVLVRHAPNLNGNGRIEGSLQQLLGESVTLSGGFVLTGDLLVPGTPTLRLNGNPDFGGTVVGTGSASPTGHKVTLNGNCSLNFLRTRTTPDALPSVPAPPQPSGTRTVTINSPGQSYGEPATLRNLTLNGDVGQVAVPPGTYGNFIANGGSGFSFGVAGATQPVIYNLQNLTLNGSTRLDIVGPVILTVANGFTANGLLGASNNPIWLQLKIAGGSFTLNGGCTVYGSVTAPAGTLIVNGNSCLIGTAQSDRLIVNGGGCIKAGSAPNQPPVASAQNLSVAEDDPLAVTLTGADPEGATLTFTVLSQPAHGTLTGTIPNLVYTPVSNYHGSDSFTFKVNDGQADSGEATVAFTVTPVNDTPVAQAQAQTTPEDTPLDLVLTGTDVDGDALTFAIASGPAHGALSGTAPNVTYTPALDYSGPDSFQFSVHDGQAAATNSVTITVNPLNDQPIANAQSVSTDEDASAPITLSGADAEGSALTFILVSGPTNGVLDASPGVLNSKVVTYTPNSNFNGADGFTFRTSDGSLTSAVAVVSLTAQPINDTPVGEALTITTSEDTATNLLLTATDVEGDTLRFTLQDSVTNGTLNGTAPELVFSPAADLHGTNTFSFVVDDGSATSAPVVVTLIVTPVNDQPVADAQSLLLDEDTSLPLTLTGTDVDGDPLTFNILTSPTNGTLTGTAPNLTYTPNTNFHGADSLTFEVNDGQTNSTPTIVGLTIQPVNDPPVAFAGADQVVNFPDGVTLNGSAWDAELSTGGTINATWSSLTGPGTVDFADRHATNTLATFSAPGTYVLRLTVDDGALTNSDDVTIFVNAAPTVSAGTNRTLFITGSITLAGSASDDGLPPGSVLQTSWSVVSGPGLMYLDNPFSPTATASFNAPGTYVLRLTANDSRLSSSSDVTITVRPVNHPPAVFAGTNQIVLFSNLVTLQGIVTDDGEPSGGLLSANWSKTAGPGAAVFGDATLPATTVSFDAPGLYVLRLTATDSELTAYADVTIIANLAPTVNAGPDQVTTTTNVLTLNGQVTDDNLPPTSLAISWAQVSGPGASLFTDPHSATTDVRFTTAGYYTLRLSATDSNVVASDDVVVAVRPPGANLPPYVSTGTNQYIALTNRTQLQGSVADDGLPFGVPLSLAWTQVSGPGTATFDSASNAQSAVTFSAAGIYQLRLTVDDTEFTNSAEVTISVYPDNQPPVVQAGPDQTLISGPTTLQGNVTDDDRPANAPLTANWRLLSGPGTIVIANTNSLVTAVTFSEAGVYTFRLTASDTEFASSDDMLITLTGNQAPFVNAGADQVLDLVLPTGGASNSLVLYPPTTDAWLYDAAQPGLSGLYGNIGTVYVNDDCLAWSGSDLFVGGGFRYANGIEVQSITRWNGCSYSALFDPRPSNPANPASPPIGFVSGGARVSPISAIGQQAFVAGGFLKDLDANGFLSFTARWDGSNWLNWEFSGPNNVVAASAMIAVSNEVYFGGQFRFQTSNIPGAPVSFNLIKWDGTNWVAFGDGIRGVNDGTNRTDPNNAWVKAIAVAPNRDVYAGGRFVMPTPTGLATNLARWDGTQWSPVGNEALSGCWGVNCGPDIEALAVSPSGELFVSGNFTQVGSVTANYIAHWNGANWLPLGSGLNSWAEALCFHNGELIAGGHFGAAGGQIAAHIARWDGTQWSAYGPGINYDVYSLASTPNGIFAGGLFSTAGGQIANNIAQFGHRALPTLDGPPPITVSNAPAGGTTLPVTVQVSQPCGNALTLSWNVDGGPIEHTDLLPAGTAGEPVSVTFTNDYSPGIHALVVTLSDGQSGPVTFSTTVTVLTPAFTTLSGVVSDDGLPTNTLIARWSQLSGPAAVNFAQPSVTNAQPTTDAYFSAAGDYVLSLAGDDTEFVTTDEVSVTVRAVGNTNRPPAVTAGPDVFVALDELASLQGAALDDALPADTLVLQWSKSSGPGTVSFSVPSVTNAPANSTATFGAPGTYTLRLTAYDGEFAAYDEVTITVSAQTNAAPVVNAGPDQTVGLADSVALQGTATDDGLPFGTIESRWEQVSGPGTALFRVRDEVTYASFSEVGDYVLCLNANDGRRASSDDVTITVLANTPGPLVQIHSPADSAIITAPTNIIGTVNSTILQDWTLQYRLADSSSSSSSNWTVLATGTSSATSNTLAQFDPTLLLNGIYELQLTATDFIGRTVTTEPVTLIVDRNLKIGHFTISFNDLAVPVPGLPLQVTRTYDSRAAAAGVQGDFGIGWTLDLRNIRLQKNRSLSRNWEEFTTGDPFQLSLAYHLNPGRERIVTITFPDGRVEKFRFDPNPLDQALLPIGYPRWRFTPLANTRGSLVPASIDEPDGQFLFFAGSIPGTASLVDLNFFTDWLFSGGTEADLDRYPTLFRYTSPEGYRYLIDEIAGLQSVTDPNGNTLLVSTNGLTWTNSVSTNGASLGIAFQRDALGRITNIVDAASHAMSYRYDSNGNLAEYVDRVGQTNGFAYTNTAFIHHLTGIVDGRGTNALRNVFDSAGRVVATLDAADNPIRYGNDVAHRTQSVTNRLGHVIVNEYDALGRVIRKSDPVGLVTGYTYDEFDNLLTVSNSACGCATRYTYDVDGNLTSETDELGRISAYAYTPLGKVLTYTDPEGNITTNSYDARGNLLSTRDSLGATTAFTYDDRGLVASMTDPRGGVTRFQYDSHGRLTNEINALGHATRYSVDANGNLKTLSRERTLDFTAPVAGIFDLNVKAMYCDTPLPPRLTNAVFSYTFDFAGRLISTLLPDYLVISNRYNEIGRISSSTDQLGQVTTTDYNEIGKPVLVTYPDGTVEGMLYDAEGQLVRHTDRGGRQTLFEYDPVGRLTRVTYPDGRTVTATYDQRGRLIAEADACQGTTTYAYDAVGNRIASTDALGHTTQFTYNSKRACTSVKDALGRTTTTEFDALNRNTRILYPNGKSRSATYSGRLITSVTDEESQITRFGYDLAGRLTATTNAMGDVLRFQRDELGNIVTTTDPQGETTFHEYDNSGRRIRSTRPDGSAESFAYDALGRIISTTNAAGKVSQFGYDARNDLIAVTNALGEVTRFTYNSLGQRTSLTDAGGHVTIWDYDPAGRLVTTHYPDGSAATTEYDTCSRISAIVDRAGGRSRYAYDVLGRVASITDPLNQSATFGYDAVGNLASTRDPAGQVTQFLFDSLNRSTGMVLPDGTSVTQTYDSRGRVATRSDALGNSTGYAYDSNGRLAAITDALGHTTQYSYEERGLLDTVTNALGHATTFVYDENGRQTQTIWADGSTQTVAYDSRGLVTSETDQRGNITRLGYDDLGRLTAVTNALGYVTRYSYDLLGRVATKTDANGGVTAFQYDSMGQLTNTIYADGTAASATYDLAGRRTSDTDARGNTTRYGYDTLGRLISVTNALNESTAFAYDELGRHVRTVDALGRTNRFEYDPLGRLTRTIYPDGTSMLFHYDAAGRRTATVDEAGITNYFGYDSIGQLIRVTNSLGSVTTYGYDALGRMVSQTDANNHTTKFEYDALDRRVKRTLPAGEYETYAYDLAGNLTNHTDFNGRVCTYSYDVLNRPIQKTPDAFFAEPPVTWAYDPVGLRTNLTDAAGATGYRYDSRYRLLEKSRTWADSGATVGLHYTYDAAGNVTNVASTAFNGVSLAYSYDPLNLLSAVRDLHNGTTAYAYDPVGNLAALAQPNGLQTQYSYDARNRVTNVTTLDASLAVLSQYLYTHGPAGNRLTATEVVAPGGAANTISHAYSYDALYRLTGEQINGAPNSGSITYAYDAVGNRLSRLSTLSPLPSTSATYNANDQLATDTYDANGNTIASTFLDPATGLGSQASDSYNVANRLIRRQTTLNSQPATLTFQYDGDGQRVGKSVGGVTTHFVVDELNPTGWPQVLEEHSAPSAQLSALAVTRVFAHGHAPLTQDQLIGTNWVASHFGQDAHGSVRYLSDTAGRVTDRFDYDALGNLIARGGTTPTTRLFTGEEFDPDLGLYNLRARYHNPATGRFWTRDIFEGFLSDPASQHAYNYAQNDPVNRLDPSGHFALAESMAVSHIAIYAKQAVNDLWRGLNSYVHGLGGGQSLKASNAVEALMIQGLSQHVGVNLGRQNFFTTMQGAPFLLAQNPNVYALLDDCVHHEVLTFDPNAPIYGCSNREAAFEFDFSSDPNYRLAENLAYASQAFAVSAAAAPVLVAAPVAVGGVVSAGFLTAGATATTAAVAGGVTVATVDVALVGYGGFAFGQFGVEQATGRDYWSGWELSRDELVTRRFQFGGSVVGGLAATPAVIAARGVTGDLVTYGLGTYARSLQATESALAVRVANVEVLAGMEGAVEAALARPVGGNVTAPLAAPQALTARKPCTTSRLVQRFGADRSLGPSDVLRDYPLPVQLELFNARAALSGHGIWRPGDGFFTVPAGTSLTVYGRFGDTISDVLGTAIETGADLSGVYSRTFGPGSTVPDLWLLAPDAIPEVELQILGNAQTVTAPTPLSTLLKPNMGPVDWAACVETLPSDFYSPGANLPPPRPHPRLP